MNKMNRGFTLVELILYLGITTMVLTASLTFAWVIIRDQIKQERVREVSDSGMFVLEKIRYHTARASAISTSTIYNIHPGKLVLTLPDIGQTTFETYQKQILIGDITTTTLQLRMTKGTNPSVDLIPENVTVTNFKILNRSTSSTASIDISLDIKSVNPSDSKTYDAYDTWNSTATLRKK